MSYWLVGESPNAATVGHPELWLLPDDTGLPHAANRLLAITGWTRPQYLRMFEHRTNLWKRDRGLWISEGRASAARIAEESEGSDGVVVLGALAAEAFGLAHEQNFCWIGRFALVPHPSGRCRFWNTPEAWITARRFFASLTPPTSGGRSIT